jgi:hypothetical protein
VLLLANLYVDGPPAPWANLKTPVHKCRAGVRAGFLLQEVYWCYVMLLIIDIDQVDLWICTRFSKYFRKSIPRTSQGFLLFLSTAILNLLQRSYSILRSDTISRSVAVKWSRRRDSKLCTIDSVMRDRSNQDKQADANVNN